MQKGTYVTHPRRDPASVATDFRRYRFILVDGFGRRRWRYCQVLHPKQQQNRIPIRCGKGGTARLTIYNMEQAI